MHTIHAENVRSAYAQGLELLRLHGEASPSRVGSVLVAPGPVLTVYERPDQRVLLDAGRDANPFFHLLESFWMLAGRQDVASIAKYNDRMRTYSDDGEVFHAAYGWRWRNHWQMDQLVVAIEELRRDPLSRRVVIAMWDPEDDLAGEGLDLPCNTHIYLRLRQERYREGLQHTRGDLGWVLDLTISCRSNDAIFGAHGANAVHFSVLQEFIAACLGARVGRLYQLSNNYHMYTEIADRVGVPGAVEPYGPTTPLFGDMRGHDLREVLGEIETLWDDDVDGEVEILLETTISLVSLMRHAWSAWKHKNWSAFVLFSSDIPHHDWRQACLEWGERRREKFR